jgi:hypothetical protein
MVVVGGSIPLAPTISVTKITLDNAGPAPATLFADFDSVFLDHNLNTKMFRR